MLLKIYDRKYIPKDSKLAARYVDRETGDIVLLYQVDRTIRVRIKGSGIVNDPLAGMSPAAKRKVYGKIRAKRKPRP